MIFTLIECCKPETVTKTINALGVSSALLLIGWTNQFSNLVVIGAFIGLIFALLNFGFASGWIRFWQTRDTYGLRANLLLLAMGSLVFFPMLSILPKSGIEAFGAIRPNGVNVMIGAFIFGIGMALSGCCSSGTFKRIGEWKAQYLIVLVSMVLGGTIAASDMEFWTQTAQLPSFSLAKDINWESGLIINLVFIAVLYLLLLRIETKSWPFISDKKGSLFNNQKILQLVIATVAISLLNLLILIETSQPWSISWVFPKIGIAVINWFELPIEWEFWAYSAQNESSLIKPLLNDNIVLTTLGFVIGIAGYQFIKEYLSKQTNDAQTTQSSLTLTKILSFTMAGLLMGYGAVIAYGCNIGAFFSGVISGSLHGWLWFACAFLGVGVAVKTKSFINT